MWTAAEEGTRASSRWVRTDLPAPPLPSTAITVVRRSDGSGTSFNFTNYLSKVSPEWKDKVLHAHIAIGATLLMGADVVTAE